MTTQAGPAVQEILRDRARALARMPPQPESGSLHVLQFRLAGEHYAVDARFVVAVHALEHLTRVPCTPPFIAGIVGVRGRILPVLDLRKFFELDERGLADLHRVIHVRAGKLQFGLLADLGEDVAHLAPEALQRALPTLTGVRADYLMGVTPEGMVILDLERIAADPRIEVNEEVAA